MSGSAWALSLAGVLIAGLAVALHRHRRERARLRGRLESAASELQKLQIAFSRFAPDAVIERIIASGQEQVGEKKEVTVLFADLVGFTALCEKLEPPVLVGILNGYFERMSQAISAHRGRISTFIGDGILALFGALEPNPWQGDDGVRAALAMRRAVSEYNEELRARGLPELAVGIGLHRGTGIAGLVGSRDLMEFAFVGRTVNVAARVQDLTRHFDTDIILTETLRKTLDPRIRVVPLPATPVKGVAEPLSIYAVERVEEAECDRE